jgi:hypothetical protein
MTPIDDELRTSLHRRADALAPPADPLAGIERRAGRIRRRRVATAVAGTGLVVAVAVPVAIGQLQNSSSSGRFAGGGQRTTPPTTQPTTPTSPPQNLVNWPARSRLDSVTAEAGLVAAVTRQWTAKHGVESTSDNLWMANLPGGGAAGIWQFWELGSRTAYTVVGQRLADGLTFIVLDQVTPKGVREISSVLQGGAFPHVVVLGPPTTGQIRYAADGRRFRPVERLQGFVGTDGWAVFDRTGPAIGQQQPDLVEVLDGDGRRIYRGQIDVGPSFPNK